MDTIDRLLVATSRTFALGIQALPRSLNRSVSVAYLLLRISDYLEDNEVMVPADKIRELNRWADALEATSDGGPADFRTEAPVDETLPDARAVLGVRDVLDAFGALPPDARAVIRDNVVASTRGMARWVERGPDFPAEADLDDYMFEVAGRVGLLLTDLFAQRSAAVARNRARMRELGRDFGLALQTVNVIRGLSGDPRRGWFYIPRSFVPGGADPAALWEDPASERSLACLDRLVRKAERHLGAAGAYVLAVPRVHRGIRIFCLLPLFFAADTLARSRHNPDVFRAEVKLTRAEVRAIALRTRLLAGSNAWIRGRLRAGGVPLSR
jgi:phytoene/squalene synthetase